MKNRVKIIRVIHCILFLLVVGVLFSGVSVSLAQGVEATAELDDVPDEYEPYMKADPEDQEWWREARFGMFVHWGPVSLEGVEIGWGRAGERRGWGSTTGTVPVERYDNLYKEFNPVEYDPAEWIDIAQSAGMQYIVFTTKHHDGFCNFDTETTDYKITSPESPYGKDIVGMLADACHEADFPLGFYYSQPDWRHPDYWTDNHDKYLDYMHTHVKELMTNYGDVSILWFDGLHGKSPEDWNSFELFKMARTLQPDILINNRAGLPGDFGTPEQRVGVFDTTHTWESCITIGNQWAWKPNDRIKSPKQCIHTLVKCAGGDGNLLFNVGPMPDGRIEEKQVEVLREMGAWLAQYGESIYDTRGGPIPPKSWGVTTRRDNTVYVHILSTTDDVIALPNLGPSIENAKLMDGTPVEYDVRDMGTLLAVPEQRDRYDTIIVLTLDHEVE